MKEQFIKNAQTQFLRETVQFYHRGNRGARETGSCQYSPQPHSPGCAIGRHISNKELTKQWDNLPLDNPGPGICAWHETDLVNLGPLSVLGKDFLASCQSLHDREEHWDGSGLSEYGIEKVKGLCDSFELDLSSVIAPKIETKTETEN